ncbi:hypothetical protein ACRALDRAFT_213571 [Sodiomyces alcalophilus JCM 7366]|uniref:uncharacterized protein n=1 Tax=Sodiomyces alcalophilus JCM 7366 TaxID=591952 RepID=UPI0039B3A301
MAVQCKILASDSQVPTWTLNGHGPPELLRTFRPDPYPLARYVGRNGNSSPGEAQYEYVVPKSQAVVSLTPPDASSDMFLHQPSVTQPRTASEPVTWLQHQLFWIIPSDRDPPSPFFSTALGLHGTLAFDGSCPLCSETNRYANLAHRQLVHCKRTHLFQRAIAYCSDGVLATSTNQHSLHPTLGLSVEWFATIAATSWTPQFPRKHQNRNEKSPCTSRDEME